MSDGMTTGHSGGDSAVCEERTMTIAVTGGTGFVGRHVVSELIGRGHAVRVLARDAAKASQELPESDLIEVISGGIFDEGPVAELVRGADACVHLIGIIREGRGGQTFERMHLGAVKRITSACAAAGVRRYVHMSAIAADPEGPAAYSKSKFEGEQAVRASGLDWTIFRPGLIHGPGGEFMKMAQGWAEGRSAPFVFLPFFYRLEQDGLPSPVNPPRLVEPVVAPVHVDDIARLFADALTTPDAIGESYNVSGPERIAFPDLLRLVRDTVPHGKEGMPAIGIPGRVAAAKAMAAKALGLGGLLPFDAGMALMGEQDAVADNTKAERHFGFEPREFSASAKAYLAG